MNAGLGGKLLVAHRDADAGGGDAPLADQLGNDAVHHLGRYRKADAGIGAGGREDRRVDADETAGGIEERAAGIARIDRRIGLDDIGELAPFGSRQAPLQRADDAGGEGLVEAERIADGEGPLPDLRSSESPRVIGGGSRELPLTRSTARS